jgi:hypothetical protein
LEDFLFATQLVTTGGVIISPKFAKFDDAHAALTKVGKEKLEAIDPNLVKVKNQMDEMAGEVVGAEKVIVKGADEIIDVAKAELRYTKTYTRSTEYGLKMSLDEVEKIYGVNGKKIVQATENKAKEIISDPIRIVQGDPVLTGLVDNKTGQMFYGRNLKSQSEIEDFLEELHPILKKRLEIHNKHLVDGTVKASVDDINRAAIAGSHSEIVAIDKALKARGAGATEADLADFIIHNKQLGGQVDNIGIPKGCPPRCAHCWFLSDGIKVIGND